MRAVGGVGWAAGHSTDAKVLLGTVSKVAKGTKVAQWIGKTKLGKMAFAKSSIAPAMGSGGFGVLGRMTEGAYPLNAQAQAALRRDIRSVAKSRRCTDC